MAKLSQAEIEERLREVEGWSYAENRIAKKFKFGDFKEAIAFVNRVAEIAEEANHHPDITIAYNKVNLTLTTHSEGGVTEKDFNLARKIEATLK